MKTFYDSEVLSYVEDKFHFSAEHPMFQYEVATVPQAFKAKLEAAEELVVVGMGGSAYPLQSLTDAAGLQGKVFYLDSVDQLSFDQLVSNLKNPVFCVVSKSGETLEIKALLIEILRQGFSREQIVAVTDPKAGSLRKWVNEESLASCEIPSDIGGRFTNFSPFHRAVLEKFSFDFESLLGLAREVTADLKANPKPLADLYSALFSREEDFTQLVLWTYGDRLQGMGRWIQQVLAESLGKLNQGKKRCGILPTLLRGPQDQHSVLQLLVDGPQKNRIWFLSFDEKQAAPSSSPESSLPKFLENLKDLGLTNVQKVLVDSTVESFRERLESPDTYQPLIHWSIGEGLEDSVRAIVHIQAFIEYAAKRLRLNAFDQPGVERSKVIARSLVAKAS